MSQWEFCLNFKGLFYIYEVFPEQHVYLCTVYLVPKEATRVQSAHISLLDHTSWYWHSSTPAIPPYQNDTNTRSYSWLSIWQTLGSCNVKRGFVSTRLGDKINLPFQVAFCHGNIKQIRTLNSCLSLSSLLRKPWVHSTVILLHMTLNFRGGWFWGGGKGRRLALVSG